MAERSKPVRVDVALVEQLEARARERGLSVRQVLELVVASWLQQDGGVVLPSSDKRRPDLLPDVAGIVERSEAHLQAQVDQLASVVLDLQARLASMPQAPER